MPEDMFLTHPKNPFLALVLTALVSLCLLPASASAQGFGITAFTGYRFGGEFEDINTGSELKLSEEQTYGIILDWQMASGDIMEFYYSRQPSSLLASGPITPGALFDIDVEYYHLGGKYRMKSTPGAVYVGSVGLTRFSPGIDGLGPETKFSRPSSRNPKRLSEAVSIPTPAWPTMPKVVASVSSMSSRLRPVGCRYDHHDARWQAHRR